MITISYQRIASVFLPFALALTLPMTSALGQEGSDGAGKKKDKKVETKFKREASPQPLTERTYNRINRAYEAIGEEKYEEAMDLLNDLLDRVEGEDYEMAVVHNAKGHIYNAWEQYGNAIESYSVAVEADVLENRKHFNAMFNLAALNLGEENYREAVRWINRWLDGVVQHSSIETAHQMAAHAYSQLEEYRNAIDHITTAIDLADEPKESWYQLWLAMHYELDEYNEAANVLQKMIKLWPEKTKYWRQLSSIYANIDEHEKALSVMALAYRKGLLEKEQSWLQLASLYQMQDVPFKAAKVLSEALDNGYVEGTKEHWEQVAHAWFQAEETEQAIGAYAKAAQYAENGELDLQRARLLLEQEQYTDAAEAAQAAIDKGGLEEETGKAYLIMGMSRWEAGNDEAARQAFRSAQDYDASSEQATQWLRHLSNEQQRRAATAGQ